MGYRLILSFIILPWFNYSNKFCFNILGNARNFEKYQSSDISTSGTPYDYGYYTSWLSFLIRRLRLQNYILIYCIIGSVMHYGAYDFAKIPFIPTIFAPLGTKIGQRDGMSDVRIRFIWPL